MDRLYYLSVMTPAGTAIAAPLTTAFPLEDAKLKRLAITIPDGHSGFTGIRILRGSQQIMPWSNNQYIVANNRTIPIDYDDEITSSGLGIVTYNTDIFDHTFYIEVVIEDLPLTPANSSMATAGPVGEATGPVQSLDPLSPDALIASVPGNLDQEFPEDLTQHVPAEVSPLIPAITGKTKLPMKTFPGTVVK